MYRHRYDRYRSIALRCSPINCRAIVDDDAIHSRSTQSLIHAIIYKSRNSRSVTFTKTAELLKLAWLLPVDSAALLVVIANPFVPLID